MRKRFSSSPRRWRRRFGGGSTAAPVNGPETTGVRRARWRSLSSRRREPLGGVSAAGDTVPRWAAAVAEPRRPRAPRCIGSQCFPQISRFPADARGGATGPGNPVRPVSPRTRPPDRPRHTEPRTTIHDGCRDSAPSRRLNRADLITGRMSHRIGCYQETSGRWSERKSRGGRREHGATGRSGRGDAGRPSAGQINGVLRSACRHGTTGRPFASYFPLPSSGKGFRRGEGGGAAGPVFRAGHVPPDSSDARSQCAGESCHRDPRCAPRPCPRASGATRPCGRSQERVWSGRTRPEWT
ncbi:hypothetical protein LX15_005399 [Streptoalloteichus tenebrarius]|uniref:Uncharacterized protein n=1 Tax=Streptoalloteichus tenebrarius (strain ATCC 17920 / DSM 40477 / JCM 4838 / CBS 697.72 / NBRC 16177 / NCIMB 11028 / NRRL B-12390 / A12253. 1 / ISP 5477) TaxID=1933 RepID=A0ABT1I1K9_STRSD|nr:hypothetical protein [Streptoalloteichus tenebrarius]